MEADALADLEADVAAREATAAPRGPPPSTARGAAAAKRKQPRAGADEPAKRPAVEADVMQQDVEISRPAVVERVVETDSTRQDVELSGPAVVQREVEEGPTNIQPEVTTRDATTFSRRWRRDAPTFNRR